MRLQEVLKKAEISSDKKSEYLSFGRGFGLMFCDIGQPLAL